MPQEWSKKPTLKSDFSEFKRQVGVIMRGNVPVNSGDPARSARTSAAHQRFLKSLKDNDSKGSRKATAPDAKAAARARMIAEGKESRKKFEKEKGNRVAKRRKLLLKIKDSQ